MSENKTTRAKLVHALKPFHAIPVENRVRDGTPDVNFCGGWIECKKMTVWPKGADRNPVRLPHPLLTSQKLWFRFRSQAHSNELLLVCLQVRKEWLFFDAMVACKVLGECTREQLIGNTCLYLDNGLDERKLRGWIQVNLVR